MSVLRAVHLPFCPIYRWEGQKVAVMRKKFCPRSGFTPRAVFTGRVYICACPLRLSRAGRGRGCRPRRRPRGYPASLRCLPSDMAQQDEIMRGILGKAGNGLRITAPFWCDYGYNIFVGDDFYSNHNLVILDCAPITFGDHVFIAPNCCFTSSSSLMFTLVCAIVCASFALFCISYYMQI